MSLKGPTVNLTVSLLDLFRARRITYDRLAVELGGRWAPSTLRGVLNGDQRGSIKLLAALAAHLTSSDELRAACGREPMIHVEKAA